MSAIHPIDRGEWWAPLDIACFLCHEKIDRDAPAIMWMGTAEVFLHAACGRELGVHLIQEAREAMLGLGEQPWRRRAALALRGALVLSEVRT
jgi:hypothetical protein